MHTLARLCSKSRVMAIPVVAAVSLIGFASPTLASASTADRVPAYLCSSDEVCLWSNTNFSGIERQIHFDGPELCQAEINLGDGDLVPFRSIINNSDHDVRVGPDPSCHRGQPRTISAHSAAEIISFDARGIESA
ncbi:MAG: peptidase inhibitor family I36 protein [Candidatus Dormibacteraceae bacterium]